MMALMSGNRHRNAFGLHYEVSQAICHLCKLPKKLCRSHIIPEFCFARFYDAKHRFIEVHDVSKGRVHRGQKGYTERLLCDVCETHINRFERHARRLFTNDLPLGDPPTSIIEISNLRYAPLKLFFLSILWRAGVSKHHVFRHITLGHHEEALRLRLLKEDPGTAESYGCMVFPLLFQREHFRDFMPEPTPGRLSTGHKTYRFVISGFVIFFVVSSHSLDQRFTRLLLRPEAPLRIFPRELTEFTFLRETWNRAAETTKDVVI
jgi:hypothetical protein